MSTIAIDKAGRVVIPKPLRDELNLQPGDELEVVSDGETISLKPIHPPGTMSLEEGIWVYSTGRPLSAETTNSAMEELRRERELRNLGKW